MVVITTEFLLMSMKGTIKLNVVVMRNDLSCDPSEGTGNPLLIYICSYIFMASNSVE